MRPADFWAECTVANSLAENGDPLATGGFHKLSTKPIEDSIHETSQKRLLWVTDTAYLHWLNASS